MKTTSAYVWSFIGKFGCQALYLFTTLLLARILNPSDFGVIGVLSVIFMVANTLSESGLGGALLMEKDLNRYNCGTISCFNFGISAFLYVTIFLTAPYIEDFYAVTDLTSITRMLGLVFVINSWGLVPRSVMMYNLQFKQISLITLSSVVIASIVSIILAIMGYGVYALVGYQIILAISSTMFFNIFSKYKISFAFDWGCFKRMYSFGLFTTLSGVIDTIYENMMTALFGKFMNLTQAGYLSQAKKIEEASSQALILTINTTSFPILSKLKNNIYEFRKEAERLQKNVPLIIAPFLLVLCVYSKEIITLLFGEKWIESASYLSLLVIAGYFMMNESINRNFIKSLGEVKRLLVYTIAKRLMGIFLIIVLGLINKNYIIYGYIISSFAGFLINSILYSKIIEENVLKTILCFIKWQLIIPFAGLLLYFIHAYSSSIIIEIILFSLFVTFYLLLLNKMGIKYTIKNRKI